jgi:hypothetical protein
MQLLLMLLVLLPHFIVRHDLCRLRHQAAWLDGHNAGNAASAAATAYVIVQHDLGGIRHQGAWLDGHQLLLPNHGIPNLDTKQQTIITAVVKPTT